MTEQPGSQPTPREPIGDEWLRVWYVDLHDGRKDHEPGMNAWAARACVTALIDARTELARLRAISAAERPLTEWYNADGSVTMLPADECVRRRKLAAVVIEKAHRLANITAAIGMPEVSGVYAEVYRDAVNAVIESVRALDAASPEPRP